MSTKRPKRPRCSFQGCRKAGSGDPLLCDDHYDELYGEDDPLSELGDRISEVINEGADRLVEGLRSAFARRGIRPTPSPDEEPVVRPPGYRRRQPPPPPNPAAELAQAKSILGFPPEQTLTKAQVTERKRALAALFHPDKGGDTAAMQRVNDAAKVVISSLK